MTRRIFLVNHRTDSRMTIKVMEWPGRRHISMTVNEQLQDCIPVPLVLRSRAVGVDAQSTKILLQ
jgi:hypothetical protein